MISKKWVRSLVGLAVVMSAAVAAPGASPSSPSVSAAPATELGAGGEFHPLTPERVLDTRTGLDVAPLGRKPTSNAPTSAAARTFDLDILGRGGVPANRSSVLGVVLNVTVANPTHAGFLAMYPKGFDIGANGENISSLINFNPGDSVPNLSIVAVGDDDLISFNPVTGGKNGQIDVIVDVVGWISTSGHGTNGARLFPVTPGRVLDTRTVPNPLGAGNPIPERSTLKLRIRGVNAVDPTQIAIVPNSGDVTAVMVNLTLVNTRPTASATFVSATPDPVAAGEVPTTSSSNVRAGTVKANMAIVPIAADGTISLFNRAGDLDLVVDVLGYFRSSDDDTTRTGRIIPLEAPFRAFDTRLPEFQNKPLQFGSSEDWSFKSFVNSVTLNGSSVGNQTALIGNLTGTDLRQDPATFLQMYPAGVPERPKSSNINVFTGQSVPNMSLLKYGAVEDDPYVMTAFNRAGTLHYLLDVYAIVLDEA